MVSVDAKTYSFTNGTANDAAPVDSEFTALFNNDDTLADALTVVEGTDSAKSKVKGRFVVVRQEFASSPSDGEHCGLEVERGSSTNVQVRWNETLNWWEVSNDGTNYYPVALVTASDPSAPTEGMVWYNSTDNVIKYYDGSAKQTVCILTTASQAQQETGTTLLAAVTPGTQHYHSSSAKAWAVIDGSGTAEILSSYNVSSLDDDGVGLFGINFTIPFSNANFCPVTSGEHTGVADGGFIVGIRGKAAGSVDLAVETNGDTTLGNVMADLNYFHVAVFGDL